MVSIRRVRSLVVPKIRRIAASFEDCAMINSGAAKPIIIAAAKARGKSIVSSSRTRFMLSISEMSR